MSRDSYGLGGRISIPDRGKSFHFLSTPSKPTLRPTQPGLFSLVIKWAGREADQSLPSSAEAKSDAIIPPLPHTSLWRCA
jgi:hypothetical protein